MIRPDGMGPDVWARIGKLRADVRDRVLERAAILIAEGIPPNVADERALSEEAGVSIQQSIGGVG